MMTELLTPPPLEEFCRRIAARQKKLARLGATFVGVGRLVRATGTTAGKRTNQAREGWCFLTDLMAQQQRKCIARDSPPLLRISE
jgi:hypothetical protein